jgi:hypothetical protein
MLAHRSLLMITWTPSSLIPYDRKTFRSHWFTLQYATDFSFCTPSIVLSYAFSSFDLSFALSCNCEDMYAPGWSVYGHLTRENIVRETKKFNGQWLAGPVMPVQNEVYVVMLSYLLTTSRNGFDSIQRKKAVNE